MKIFNYNDYIKCIHRLRLNAVLQLAEEGTKYHLENENIKYSNDKLIKNILKDKKEVEKFINCFLEPRKSIKSNELSIYTNEYIAKKYRSKKDYLIYKWKSQDIFFLIEHELTVDNSMPYRMLNYCIDIMQEWNRNKKLGKNTNYPIIVPIVIYTGSEKWKISQRFSERQIGSYVLEKNNIDLKYNLIDINKIPKQVLLEQGTIFGYTMLIKKSKNKEELIKNTNLITDSTNNKSKLENLLNTIENLLDYQIEESQKQELIKKIQNKLIIVS